MSIPLTTGRLPQARAGARRALSSSWWAGLLGGAWPTACPSYTELAGTTECADNRAAMSTGHPMSCLGMMLALGGLGSRRRLPVQVGDIPPNYTRTPATPFVAWLSGGAQGRRLVVIFRIYLEGMGDGDCSRVQRLPACDR